jgi:hypothetical protein
VIGDSAFSDCTSLESVVIPGSVTEIRRCAFYGCTSLRSVTIPASVTEIGTGVFWYCSSLESIVVAEGNPIFDSRESCNAIVETETNALLFGCKSTIIPNSVKVIEGSAFLGCSLLENITIPKGVTKICESVFEKCTSLVTVTLPVGVNKIEEYVFDGCDSLSTIYVPAKKTDYYKKRLPWHLHDKIVELAPEKKTNK